MYYVGFGAIKAIYVGVWTARNYSRAVPKSGALCKRGGVFRKCLGLAGLHEAMNNGNFMHLFLKLCEKIGFVLGVLAGLRVILMPVLRPRGGVVVKVDSNIGDPEVLGTNNTFCLVCALQIHCSPLSYHIPANNTVLSTRRR